MRNIRFLDCNRLALLGLVPLQKATVLTLALFVGLGEAALGDPLALVIKALSAGHAGRGRTGAVGGGRSPRAPGRRSSWWSSRIARPVGVVAWTAVHGLMTALHLSTLLSHI